VFSRKERKAVGIVLPSDHLEACMWHVGRHGRHVAGMRSLDGRPYSLIDNEEMGSRCSRARMRPRGRSASDECHHLNSPCPRDRRLPCVNTHSCSLCFCSRRSQHKVWATIEVYRLDMRGSSVPWASASERIERSADSATATVRQPGSCALSIPTGCGARASKIGVGETALSESGQGGVWMRISTVPPT